MSRNRQEFGTKHYESDVNPRNKVRNSSISNRLLLKSKMLGKVTTADTNLKNHLIHLAAKRVSLSGSS